jgi:uncharacterized protein YndB with AHSA1/START domain
MLPPRSCSRRGQHPTSFGAGGATSRNRWSCVRSTSVGGAWRYVTRDNDTGTGTGTGTEMAWRGEYREIVPDTRLVSTELFEANPDAATLNTITFAESGGVTTLTINVLHTTRTRRDGHLASGMEHGLQHSLDRFERLITQEDRP